MIRHPPVEAAGARARSGRFPIGLLVPLAGLLAAVGLGAFSLEGRRPRNAVRPPEPAISFRDVAGERGVDYAWGPSPKTPLDNRESFGNGCAFLDYDSDGWQ